MKHLTMEELEAGLSNIRQSPRDNGIVEMIVRRPDIDEREVLEQGELDIEEGLVGDTWRVRGSGRTEDGSAHPEMQLNIMNSRVIALAAQSRDRWPMAGDQFFVDMDLSEENLPPGTQLSFGTAILEVTAIPHNGCKKFVARFGLDAMQFVNGKAGKKYKLRGINAKVVKSGIVKTGDPIKKLNNPV